MPISSWTADRRQVRVRRGQLGFTLLELLTVLAVVSLVIAVALPHLPKRADVIAVRAAAQEVADGLRQSRSEEHTSELQSLMRISYAVFCLKKKKKKLHTNNKSQ